MLQQSPQRRLNVAHQNRGAHSLAGDVGHEIQNAARPALRQTHAVEVIAAHLPRLPVTGRDFPAWLHRHDLGKQIRLDTRRQLEFLLNLPRHQRFLQKPCILERSGGAAGHGQAELQILPLVAPLVQAEPAKNQADHSLTGSKRNQHRSGRNLQAAQPFKLSASSQKYRFVQILVAAGEGFHLGERKSAGAEHVLLPVAPGMHGIAGDRPAPREGERQHLDDFFGIQRRAEAPAKIEEGAQFLEPLVHSLVQALRFLVRHCVRDRGGSEASKMRNPAVHSVQNLGRHRSQRDHRRYCLRSRWAGSFPGVARGRRIPSRETRLNRNAAHDQQFKPEAVCTAASLVDRAPVKCAAGVGGFPGRRPTYSAIPRSSRSSSCSLSSVEFSAMDPVPRPGSAPHAPEASIFADSRSPGVRTVNAVRFGEDSVCALDSRGPPFPDRASWGDPSPGPALSVCRRMD